LPNPELLLTPLQNREAQRSSSLEGTIATPHQLALFEIDATDSALEKDAAEAAREVFNYSRALRLGEESREQIPLSLRTIHIYFSHSLPLFIDPDTEKNGIVEWRNAKSIIHASRVFRSVAVETSQISKTRPAFTTWRLRNNSRP